jgi:hypothetical protein
MDRVTLDHLDDVILSAAKDPRICNSSAAQELNSAQTKNKFQKCGVSPATKKRAPPATQNTTTSPRFTIQNTTFYNQNLQKTQQKHSSTTNKKNRKNQTASKPFERFRGHKFADGP